jgi:hypothetical protein
MNNNMLKEINECRICNNSNLIPILSLGYQSLTGIFPREINHEITTGPLALVWCRQCGLLQLSISYDLKEMYGDSYGYRSGLNSSMVNHLTGKIHALEKMVNLNHDDVVLDIGSNDATSLKAFSTPNITRVGIDPTGYKFKEFYMDDIQLLPEFFSAEIYKNSIYKKAKLITTIAMFYDIESPIQFAKDIEAILDDNGIWHFEQSYMPSMLRMNSYDTICHEHLEFYSLHVIKYILEEAGLKMINVGMNAVNGGSFAVTACKVNNLTFPVNNTIIDWMFTQEIRMGLDLLNTYKNFEERVYRHRSDLIRLVKGLVKDGKKILGYGASTKGNVLLQFCNFTNKEIIAIADVNPDKYGCYTPGTKIPIVSEEDANKLCPDYYIVLPWHFKEGIIKRESNYLAKGGKLIFPLPEIEII